MIHLNNKNNDLFYVKNQQSAPAKTYGVSLCHIKYQQVHSDKRRWVVPELPVVDLDQYNNNL